MASGLRTSNFVRLFNYFGRSRITFVGRIEGAWPLVLVLLNCERSRARINAYRFFRYCPITFASALDRLCLFLCDGRIFATCFLWVLVREYTLSIDSAFNGLWLSRSLWGGFKVRVCGVG